MAESVSQKKPTRGHSDLRALSPTKGPEQAGRRSAPNGEVGTRRSNRTLTLRGSGLGESIMMKIVSQNKRGTLTELEYNNLYVDKVWRGQQDARGSRVTEYEEAIVKENLWAPQYGKYLEQVEKTRSPAKVPSEGPDQQGNFQTKRSQHPLLSKHRWSKTDVQKAPKDITYLKLLKLQQELENSRSEVNRLKKKTSTDRLDACTEQPPTATNISANGEKDASPRVSRQHTTRKHGSSNVQKSSANKKPVPIVLKKDVGSTASQKVQKTSNSHQVGRSQQLPSTATGANSSKRSSTASQNHPSQWGGSEPNLRRKQYNFRRHGSLHDDTFSGRHEKKTRTPKPASKEGKPNPPDQPPVPDNNTAESQTDPASNNTTESQTDPAGTASAECQTEEQAEKIPRRLPQNNGATYAATLIAGPVTQSTAPIYTPTVTKVNHERPPQSNLRKVRWTKESDVEEELFQYLRSKTWCTPLDDTKLPALAKKAERFFLDYDGQKLTSREQNDIIIRTCIAQLKPDPLLTTLRNNLKNDADLKEAIKNGRLVHGVIGNTVGWLGKKNHHLPKKEK